MEQDKEKLHYLLNYLRGINKVFEEDWQKAAKKIGLTQAEQHTLWIVYLEKEVTVTRIAEIGLWDVSTVMQVLKRLKEKELVETKKKSSDRRVSYVYLTEKGKQKQKQSSEGYYQFYEFFEEYRGQDERNKKVLDDALELLKECNRHFHGRDFVNWIEHSGKTFSQ
ncbi:MarR family winged helix-turn-helix transcriptional regulator [Bacillus taeanensis]|uniref:HTH marR-type domain-containing protein n=1 Tax=Bacillus taeanensis TaxID=273032 RepID=A0A366Y2K0_9BACI|nr:MarR family transcriptional regulator [Bacillus taeanensis]RBW70633.1 hypothetical protein DS031_06390 [Bacillus taeanensis]